MKLRSTLLVLILAIVCLLLGYLTGWASTRGRDKEAVQRIVAMSWGDGKYGKAFCGAEVFLQSSGSTYSVRARIWIGRGNDYWHDLGELGTVSTPEQAVEKWGRIEWHPEDVTIGPGDPVPVIVPRSKLEAHR